jgi:hypothetical protein
MGVLLSSRGEQIDSLNEIDYSKASIVAN